MTKASGAQVTDSESPIQDEADTGVTRDRDSLLLLARLRYVGDEESMAVRVRNLSAGGLMAELSGPVDSDRAIEVEVRGIGWVAGRIAWQTAGRCGVAFDKEIDPQRARKPVGAAKQAAARSGPFRG